LHPARGFALNWADLCSKLFPVLLVSAGLGCNSDEPRPTRGDGLGAARQALISTTTLEAAGDTYLQSGSPNQNVGGDTGLSLQSSGRHRTLLFFNKPNIIAAVGTGTLISARIELKLSTTGTNWGSSGRPISIHRLKQASAEYQATWNCAQDSNVNNQQADCSGANAWSMSATDPSLQPWLSPATATATITNGQTGTVSFDVTADVAAILSGSFAGHGWLIKKVDEGQNGSLQFAAREQGADQGPRLLLELDGATGAGQEPGPVVGNATLLPTQDSQIRQGQPNQNFGADHVLRLQASGKNRGLIRFEPTAIAPLLQGPLVRARLRLPISEAADNWGPDRVVGAHRLRRAWSELGATWNCANDSNTANSAPDCAGESAWVMWGSTAEVPWSDPPTATTLVTSGQTGTLELDVTRDVACLLAGHISFQGWLLKKELESQSGRIEFHSRETASPPSLLLEWSNTTGVVVSAADCSDGGPPPTGGCTPSAPVDVTCDGVDDDCDGVVDDDYGVQDVTCGSFECTGTGTSSCVGGQVVTSCTFGAPNDGRACTADSCDSNGIPVYTPVAAGAACGNGDACDGVEVCDGFGDCLPGEPPVVDDENPCTVDACNPTTGVTHAPAAAGVSCADLDQCNGQEACDGTGACAPGPALDTDDANPCTTDTCDPIAGVLHAPAPAGTECGNLMVCNGAGACRALPPDPIAVAPPNNPTTVSTVLGSTSFLYTGPNAIQTGVAPGTIEVQRATVLSGKVTALDGSALPGVAVTIKGHPEFGQTFSRVDGAYDLAVNGGGSLILALQKPSLLPVQRTVGVEGGGFVEVEPVAMISLDSAVTQIDFAAGSTVAQSSVSVDEDGPRQATVIFQQGTEATMHFPDGSSELLDTMAVRLTEYTVGEYGPAAMPGNLPATSAYTYAAELSADEALAAGASSITFDRPAALYVDNFIGFPVGSPVPVGFYDSDRGVWVGDDDGVVIGILDTSSGFASVDVDGSGAPATALQLAALGMSEAELQQLAALFTPGHTLWRVTVDHFSTIDCNWPSGAPDDAAEPGFEGDGAGGSGGGSGGGDPPLGPGESPDPDSESCEEKGSQIRVGGQTMGQSLQIAGTPYSLNYSSRLALGYRDKRVFRVRLTRDSVPASMKRIELEISFQGQREVLSFPPSPNLYHDVMWDGRDKYGRAMQGEGFAEFKITYVYPRHYRTPIGGLQLDEFRSWALASGYTFIGDPARFAQEAKLVRTWRAAVTNRVQQPWAWDARGEGLGGWTLDAHHTYDPVKRVVVTGSGEVRTKLTSFGPTSRRIAGGTTCGNGSPTSQASGFCCTAPVGVLAPQSCVGDGGPADGGFVGFVVGALPMPDRSILFTSIVDFRRVNERGDSRTALRRISPDGLLSTIHPSVANVSWSVAATASYIETPLALGPDGAVYIGGEDGIKRANITAADVADVTRVAGGSGPFGSQNDDGVPAASIRFPVRGLAVGADGIIYATLRAESGGAVHRVRAIGTDGIVRTIAGTGVAGFAGDEGPAQDAQLSSPSGLSIGPDGSLYIADTANRRIRRVTPDGIIHTVAGLPATGADNDGALATQTNLSNVVSVTAADNGSFYFVDLGAPRYVASTGIQQRVMNGPAASFDPLGPLQGLALRFSTGTVLGAWPLPNGTALIAHNRYLRSVDDPLPGVGANDIVVSSAQGNEVYRFDAAGRHLDTREPATGAIQRTFGYDARGVLSTITDRDGNVTTLQRNAAGQLERIVGPHGQATEVSLDANGYLASVSDPAGGVTQFGYTEDGLMTSMVDARGGLHEFEFDSIGRLATDTGPDGNTKTFDWALETGGRTVSRSTGDGVQASYRSSLLPGGGVRRESSAAGLTNTTEILPTGTTNSVRADGLRTTTRLSADPRFGMMAPLEDRRTETTPLGIPRTTTGTRTFGGLSTGFSETSVQNGKTTSLAYDAPSRTFTVTSAEGRQLTTTLDSSGRPVRTTRSGLLPLEVSRNSLGQISEVRQGSRVTTFDYASSGGNAGYLSGIVDANGDLTSFERDAMSRMTARGRGGETVLLGRDAGGNLISVTPPGGATHELAYTFDGRLQSYTAPAVGSEPTITTYDHDSDGRVIAETLPDGSVVQRTYDSAGRADTVSIPGGAMQYVYHPGGVSGAGRPSSILGPYGTNLSFGYDGELVTSTGWSGNSSGTALWQYNGDFLRSQQTLSGSSGTTTTSFDYDRDLLLICASPSSCVSASALKLVRNAQHGLPQSITMGSTTETRSYNAYGELAQQATNFASTPLVTLTYDTAVAPRDGIGRVLQKTQTILGETHVFAYEYDAVLRLTDVVRDGSPLEHFEYGPNGNRSLAWSASEGTRNATHDAQDRMQSFGDWTFSYNPNGQLQTKTNQVTHQTWAFNYDALGNLLSVELPNGSFVEYLVDGLGRRVGKKLNGSLIKQWLYGEGSGPIAELSGSGALVAQFSYASRVNVPDYVQRGTTSFRVISDEVGSPLYVVAASSSSNVPFRATYDAFGQVVGSGLDWMPFGFAGGLYDPDTGLLRFGARDYDPLTGRWLSKDPSGIAAGGVNLYAYAMNDPINRIDPKGRIPALLAGYILYEAFCHAAAFALGSEKFPHDYGDGEEDMNSAPRHCYSSCIATRLCLQPQNTFALGVGWEVIWGFSDDWREDISADWQGIGAGAQFWEGCEEQCRTCTP
jgi:RHS repeat-associated protein